MTQGSRLRFLHKLESQEGFRTAVSLHSHTSSSRESLDFIPRVCAKVPILRQAERAYRRRYERVHGHSLDYTQVWWTPPLTPDEALRVETEQIEALGLRQIVSLTEHDTMDGVLQVRNEADTRATRM